MFKKILNFLFLYSSLLGRGQNIYTIGGNGFTGGGGDGGLAINASFNTPVGIAIDGSGNIFFSAQGNECIKKIDASGIITTFAGTSGFGGYAGDGGLAISAKLNAPAGVAIDAIGNVYIADYGNSVIRKVSVSGSITTIAGSGTSTVDGILASSAAISVPSSVAVDASGNVFLVDDHRVRKINSFGIITTIAGTGAYGFSGDGGPATNATFKIIEAIAVDGSGNLYIADTGNSCIRKVDTLGIVTTIVGIGGSGGYSGDNGPASSAQIGWPTGIAIDHVGNLFISDNDRVTRKVNSAGIISTISGTIVVGGYNGSGISASSALLNWPSHLIIDMNGNLFIADKNNHRVREICFATCLAEIDEKKISKFDVYPNPVSETLFLKADFLDQNGKIEIVNMTGHVVMKSILCTSIDVSQIPKGIYFLKITIPNHTMFYSKFIKE